MASWKYTPTSLNGVAIVGGSVASAYFKVANGPLFTQKVGAVMAEITGKGSQDVRGQPQPAVLRLAVNLAGVDQTDLTSLHTRFNEQAGLVYLRITDGAGAVWRTAVRVLGIEPVNTLQFEVVLSVPDPRWEEDTVNTDSKLAQQASPINVNPTNAGDRTARPKFTFTANAAKSNSLDDYMFSLRGFLVNRSPLPLVNTPAYLMDIAGAAGRHVTNTSGSGASVIQTFGATGNGGVDIAAGATTITLTSAAGFSANGGLGYITDSRGVGSDEQFSYTGKSGNVLQGVVKGLGGTADIAHTIAQCSSINPSGTLKNGDDVQVYLNDVPVRSDVVAWNSGASDVVVSVTLPAAVAMSLVAAVTAAQTQMTFVESLNELPSKGFIVQGSEVISYASKSGKTISGCVRGVWGTTAATHAAALVCYPNPVCYTIATGYAKATPPSRPVSGRPAIQLPASSNQTFKWGDETNDANTVYFDRDNPDRPASWSMGFDSDGNSISPLLQASITKASLQFKDDVPGDGSPPYNFAEIALPQGIHTASANNVKNDWTPAVEILNLELWTRDEGGTLKLQDQLQQSAAAAARGLPAALATINYGLKLKGRYNVVTGHKGTGTNVIVPASTTAAGATGMPFKLEKMTRVRHCIAQLSSEVSESLTISAEIRPLNATDATKGGKVPTNKYHDKLASFGSQVIASVTPALIKFTPETPLTLEAGEYEFCVRVAIDNQAVNDLLWDARLAAERYGRGRSYNFSTVVDANDATLWVIAATSERLYFLICTEYDINLNAPINEDQPVSANTTGLRTGTMVSFDKTIIDLSTSQSLYVNRNTPFVSGASSGSRLHVIGTLVNGTTGDSFAVNKWMKLTSTLAIDCDLRTVTYTEDGVDYALTKAIAPANTADWMPLQAGVNALSFTDASLLAPGSLDLVTTWRGERI